MAQGKIPTDQDDRLHDKRIQEELEKKVAELSRTNELLQKEVEEGRKAGEALREAERNYRELVQHAAAGIYQVDFRTQRFTSVNDIMCQALGYSREELLAMSPLDIIDEESRARFANRMARWHAGEEPDKHVEYRIRTRDGRTIETILENTFSTDEDGKPLGATVIVHDITERKRMEAALRESEEKFKALSEAAAALIIIYRGNRHLYVNQAAESILGYTREEMLAMEDFIGLFHENYRELAKKRAVARMGGEAKEARYEAIVITKTGEERWLDVCSNLVSYQGAPAGVVMGMDITERKRMEAALRESRDKLEMRVEERTAELQQAYRSLQQEMEERERLQEHLRQAHKMEAIGTLASGIAHDFNNMLAIIMGNAELALDEDSLGSIHENLKQILHASKRSRDLIKQILTFSRKDGGKGKIIEIVPVVRETHDLLRASLPTTINMELKVRAKADTTIVADPTQIEQVIVNLASNAGYAMRETGGTLTIGLSTVTGRSSLFYDDVAPGRYVKLTVKDTGRGIPPEVQQRMFDPFFTTKEPGVGTGMGLSVVYGIVKGYGGTIEAESEVGKGSTFIVLLPQADVFVRIEREKDEDVVLSKGAQKHILFVDDEPALVHMTTRLLERLGYRVTALTDSTKALKIFKEAPSSFDLVITDQTMPDMTGLALAPKLLAVRTDLPIILCTGFSETVSSETAKEAGIREFIMKPITGGEMARAIRRVLEQWEGIK
jgi:PAS domain S-box-containing protein